MGMDGNGEICEAGAFTLIYRKSVAIAGKTGIRWNRARSYIYVCINATQLQ